MKAGLAEVVDDLYREVVMEPERWGEGAFAEWLETLASDAGPVDRFQAKQLRRAARVAMKLQNFWSSADAGRRHAEPSWRARVDIAVGVPAWRPGLELAMSELEVRPSQEAFDDVRERFRVVNGSTWLEGTTFAEWSKSGNGGSQ